MATTTYDVLVKYNLKDNVSSRSKRLEGSLSRMGNAAKRVGKSLTSLPGILAGAGMAAGLKKLVTLNVELENTQNQLAAVLMHSGQTSTFEQSFARSAQLVKEMRKEAEASPATFRQLADFASGIANKFAAAGGSANDLASFSKQAVVAAKAFGESEVTAAMDIRQALSAGVTERDRFANTLLAGVNVTKEAFNKLSKNKRLKVLQKAMNHKAIRSAAKAYEKSFSGAFSTFQSKLSEIGQTVGQPLFEALTKQLMVAGQWLTANQQRVTQFAKSTGAVIAKVFRAGVKMFNIIAEHKEVFIALGKVALIGKGLSVITGGLGQLNSKAGMAAAGLGAVYVAATAFSAWVHKKKDASLAKDSKHGGLQAFLNNNRNVIGVAKGRENASGLFMRQIESFVGPNGKLDKAKLASQTNLSASDITRAGQLYGKAKKTWSNRSRVHGPAFNPSAPSASSPSGKAPSTVNNFNVKATIEVASDDPDRFAIGLENYFKDSVKNPSQAKFGQRDGH